MILAVSTPEERLSKGGEFWSGTFWKKAVNFSHRPKGAVCISPGQSEATPWDHEHHTNPFRPERAVYSVKTTAPAGRFATLEGFLIQGWDALPFQGGESCFATCSPPLFGKRSRTPVCMKTGSSLSENGLEL